MGAKARKKRHKLRVVNGSKPDQKPSKIDAVSEEAATQVLQAVEKKNRKKFMKAIRKVCLEHGYDLNPVASMQIQKIGPESLAAARKESMDG